MNLIICYRVGYCFFFLRLGYIWFLDLGKVDCYFYCFVMFFFVFFEWAILVFVGIEFREKFYFEILVLIKVNWVIAFIFLDDR